MTYHTSSFQTLRRGGLYSMHVGHSTDSVRVSVSPNKIDPEIILVKYLNNSDRGTTMAVYEDQIARGSFRFYKMVPPAGTIHTGFSNKHSSSHMLNTKFVYLAIALLYAFVIYVRLSR